MLRSFPPFHSPNPEAVTEPLEKPTAHRRRSSISLESSSLSSLASSWASSLFSHPSPSENGSIAISEEVDHSEDEDDAHPNNRSRKRRNPVRKCVPPHTRLIKTKRSSTQSPPPVSILSAPSRTDSSNSSGSEYSDTHVHFAEEGTDLARRNSADSGTSSVSSLRSSMRKNSPAYEDSLRIGGGAWHGAVVKKVQWAPQVEPEI